MNKYVDDATTLLQPRSVHVLHSFSTGNTPIFTAFWCFDTLNVCTRSISVMRTDRWLEKTCVHPFAKSIYVHNNNEKSIFFICKTVHQVIANLRTLLQVLLSPSNNAN